MPAFRGRAALIAASLYVGAAALALSGCAATSPNPCKADAERSTAQLVFGRAEADGVAVSEAEFARFLDKEVSPRFPDGLTVIDAQGRWTPPAGTVIHDPSKMVMIVLRGDPNERAKLDAVRAAYRRRFNQQSVLLMTGSACAAS